mmetsp:Transcript_142337/g.361433  ORF Transcript_142337/g.361433 Transcript_142337/m.361433 type:complete len:269 (-) Transcript_142337:289-1095(-)
MVIATMASIPHRMWCRPELSYGPPMRTILVSVGSSAWRTCSSSRERLRISPSLLPLRAKTLISETRQKRTWSRATARTHETSRKGWMACPRLLALRHKASILGPRMAAKMRAATARTHETSRKGWMACPRLLALRHKASILGPRMAAKMRAATTRTHGTSCKELMARPRLLVLRQKASILGPRTAAKIRAATTRTIRRAIPCMASQTPREAVGRRLLREVPLSSCRPPPLLRRISLQHRIRGRSRRRQRVAAGALAAWGGSWRWSLVS